MKSQLFCIIICITTQIPLQALQTFKTRIFQTAIATGHDRATRALYTCSQKFCNSYAQKIEKTLSFVQPKQIPWFAGTAMNIQGPYYASCALLREPKKVAILNSQQLFQKGMKHLSAQRYAGARVSFEQVIQQSSNMYLQARACICLGEIHFLIESEYDIKKALNYFEVAYQQTDNPEAQAIAAYQMGSIHVLEADTSGDYQKAFKYLAKAAEQTDSLFSQAHAQLLLTGMYQHGLGVKPDLQKAYEYAQKAANQTHNPIVQHHAQVVLQELKIETATGF